MHVAVLTLLRNIEDIFESDESRRTQHSERSIAYTIMLAKTALDEISHISINIVYPMRCLINVTTCLDTFLHFHL